MLSDPKIPVRLKLSALWVAVMLLYIYGDIFGFFEQNTLLEITSGKSGFISTERGLLAAASVMAIPSLMVFLSLVLGPRTTRWANIVLGVTYTIIIIATLPGSWFFYKLLGAIEIILTLTIVWHAFNWPRAGATASPLPNDGPAGR